jgi:hypothetical protein
LIPAEAFIAFRDAAADTGKLGAEEAAGVAARRWEGSAYFSDQIPKPHRNTGVAAPRKPSARGSPIAAASGGSSSAVIRFAVTMRSMSFDPEAVFTNGCLVRVRVCREGATTSTRDMLATVGFSDRVRR